MKFRTALLTFLLLPALLKSAEEVVFACEYFPPYILGINHPKNPGFAVEFIRAIFKGTNVTPVFRNMGWRHVVENHDRVKNFNAVVGVAKADAPELIFPDLPIARTGFAVYSKGKKFDRKDVRKYRIGTQKDISVADWLDDYRENQGKPFTFRNWETWRMFRELLKNNLDFAVERKDAANYILRSFRKKDRESIKMVFEFPEEVFFYTAFLPENWKKHAEYRTLYNRKAAWFLKTPEYKKLREKYNLPENVNLFR